MIFNSHSLPSLNSDVRWRLVDDEAVVLVQECSEILVVNRLGARILEMLDGQHQAMALVDILFTEEDVTREQLQADVFSYLDELSEAGVISFSAEK